MTNVKRKQTYVIKPSKPTCEGIFPLTEWDQTGVITHIPTVYFYKPSNEWIASSKSIIETLKESLSNVLVHFYPLAGRARWIGRGRLELICNSMGVELIEAESSSELSEFGDFSSQTHKYQHLIPFVDYDKPMDELPMIVGQLTVFRCGGICLGVTISHLVADGQSALHFMTEWARLARGKPLQTAPYIDHDILRGQDSLKDQTQTRSKEYSEFSPIPLLIGKTDNVDERIKPTTVTILPLDKDQVKTLKSKANKEPHSTIGRPYSRYQVIAAHVWRTSCKARYHHHDQSTCLGFSVDMRPRLNPPLPPKFFGNAILDVVTSSKSGYIIEKPLSYACSKIREALEKANDDQVWANIGFFHNQPDLTLFQDLHARKTNKGPFYGNPNIGVISWLTLPIYGLDFGWGKEVYMGPGTHDSDGDCLVLPGSENDGSVKVALCFQLAYIDAFKKYFYEDVYEI